MPSRGLNPAEPSMARRLPSQHSEYDLTMSYNRINHYFNWKCWPLDTVTSYKKYAWYNILEIPAQGCPTSAVAIFVTAKRGT